MNSRRTTSYDIPRVSALPRLLRLRADEKLHNMLAVPAEGEPGVGRLEVPSRETLRLGEVIRVEVSLGPMADEVVLKGSVTSIQPREGHSPLVVIELDERHTERARYVGAVMAKERAATARRYRRVEASLPVRWRHGMFSHQDTTVDLSQGGAFISSAQRPNIDTELQLTLELPAGEITLRATVVWHGFGQGVVGFGVQFVDRDPDAARALADAVRTIEDRDFRS